MASIAKLPTKMVTGAAKLLGIHHGGAYRHKAAIKLFAVRAIKKCRCCGNVTVVRGPKDMKKQVAELRRIFKSYKVEMKANPRGAYSIYVREIV